MQPDGKRLTPTLLLLCRVLILQLRQRFGVSPLLSRDPAIVQFQAAGLRNRATIDYRIGL
jgi:hypothetical protein